MFDQTEGRHPNNGANNMRLDKSLISTAAALTFTVSLVAQPALAADQNQNTHNNAATPNAMSKSSVATPSSTVTQSATNASRKMTTGTASSENQQDARGLVKEAISVVKQMKSDTKLWGLVQKAKGIYIVPDFGRAALLVGGRGGAGVMLSHKNGKWSAPGFYDIGGVSVGAQAGVSAGSVAFLLMSDDAVKNFNQGNKFSLNADSGISIINYSANAQASWGKGDIILWSDTEGAFAGAEISVSDINWDDGNNRAYYNSTVTPSDILSGQTGAAKAERLRSALAG